MAPEKRKRVVGDGKPCLPAGEKVQIIVFPASILENKAEMKVEKVSELENYEVFWVSEKHSKNSKNSEHFLRFVLPYHFEFRSYCKRRWIGNNILDIFKKEFVGNSVQYYERAVENGKIKINELKCEKDQFFEDNDLLTHIALVQENPILFRSYKFSQKIENIRKNEASVQLFQESSFFDIPEIFENADFLAVDKPSSLPVHPAGGCRFNSLLEIIKLQKKVDKSTQKVKNDFLLGCTDEFLPVHRLDRLTSGLVIFGKNRNFVQKISKLMTETSENEKKIEKIYLARVKGKFPEFPEGKGDLQVFEDPQFLERIGKVGKKMVKVKGFISCSDHRVGRYEFSENASGLPGEKNSESDFIVDFFDEKNNESVVYCRPRTGRTHQLRLHLQALGFPISNDVCYGGGGEGGRGGGAVSP